MADHQAPKLHGGRAGGLLSSRLTVMDSPLYIKYGDRQPELDLDPMPRLAQGDPDDDSDHDTVLDAFRIVPSTGVLDAVSIQHPQSQQQRVQLSHDCKLNGEDDVRVSTAEAEEEKKINNMLATEVHEDVLHLIYAKAPEDQETLTIVREIDEREEYHDPDLNTDLIMKSELGENSLEVSRNDCLGFSYYDTEPAQYFFDARSCPADKPRRNARWLNGGLGCTRFTHASSRVNTDTVSSWFAARPRRRVMEGLGRRRSSSTVCGVSEGYALGARLPNLTRKVLRLPVNAHRGQSVLLTAMATAVCVAMGWTVSAILFAIVARVAYQRCSMLQLVLVAVAAKKEIHEIDICLIED